MKPFDILKPIIKNELLAYRNEHGKTHLKRAARVRWITSAVLAIILLVLVITFIYEVPDYIVYTYSFIYSPALIACAILMFTNSNVRFIFRQAQKNPDKLISQIVEEEANK